MTSHAHQTAPTQIIEVNGIGFAYRRFGNPKWRAAGFELQRVNPWNSLSQHH
jgi:hypothetical protein